MTAYHIQNAWRKWNDTRDDDASEAIIRQYKKPLVDYHVNRIFATLPNSIQKSELESLGMIGLYEALLKYDPNQNTKFETYASQRIRGTILDGLRKEDRMSRTYRKRYKKIQAAFIELEQNYGREVSAEEVAEALDMSKEELDKILAEQLTSELLSMDDEIQGNADGKRYIDTIYDPSVESPEEEVVKNDLILEMGKYIQKLTEREQLIVSLFYKEELSITEIGKVLDLSKSRVSQLHSQALAKLKQWMS